MNERLASQILIVSSLASVLLSAYGFLVGDFWLASTQWLGVATILGVYAVWLKIK